MPEEPDAAEQGDTVPQDRAGNALDILNLDAIRASVVEHGHIVRERFSATGIRLSRRNVFQGTVAGFISVRLRTGESRDSRSCAIKVEKVGNCVSFVQGDRVIFAVDADLFLPTNPLRGLPTLRLLRASASTTVTLRNATYPGTSLPADVIIQLRPGRNGDALFVAFTRLGWKFRIKDVQAWADDRIFASCVNGKTFIVASLGSAGEVRIPRRAVVEFRSDWSIVTNRAMLGVGAFLDPGQVQRLRVQPVPADQSRLLLADGKPVTIIEVSRGQHRWSFRLAELLPEAANLIGPAEPADVIRIELSEDLNRHPIAALVAETKSSESAWQIGFTAHGQPSQLPLHDLRHAAAFRRGQDSFILLATIPPAPVKLRWGVYSLLLDAPSDRPALELVSIPGKTPRTRLTAGLKGIVVPVDIGYDFGALLTRTAEVPESSSIDIRFDGVPPSPPLQNACVVGYDSELHLCSWSLTLLRPRDMLKLTFTFQGYKLTQTQYKGEPYVLAQTAAGITPRIIVTFAPQSLAEYAVPESDITDNDSLPGQITPIASLPLPFKVYPTGSSRVVFIPPPWHATSGLLLRFPDLLDWRLWQMDVSEFAIPPLNFTVPPVNSCDHATNAPALPAHWQSCFTVPLDKIPPNPKTLDEFPNTALNLKHFIVVSPNAWSVFYANNDLPAVIGNDTISPIFHVRLGVFNKTGTDTKTGHLQSKWDPAFRRDLATVRAVACVDNMGENAIEFLPSNKASPSEPLSEAKQIVGLSANFNLLASGSNNNPLNPGAQPADKKYSPLPIPFDQLMLSSMGAQLKLYGHWNIEDIDSESNIRIESWIEEISWGFIQHTLVAIAGYGLCTGHRIAFIEEVKREFHLIIGLDGEWGWSAMTVSRKYCKVENATMEYPVPNLDSGTEEGRCWPFISVTLSPTTTPYLKDPSDITTNSSNADSLTAFWMFPLADDTAPFYFNLHCVDQNNRKVDLQLPLLWVDRRYVDTSADASFADHLQVIVNKYREATPGIPNPYRRADAASQAIAYAKPLAQAHPEKPPPRSTAFPTNGIWTDVTTRNESKIFITSVPLDAEPKMTWPQSGNYQYLNFMPTVERAVVAVSASSQMTTDGTGTGLCWFKYSDIFRTYGFGNYNGASSDKPPRIIANSIFMDFYAPRSPTDEAATKDFTNPVPFTLPGSKAGGLAFPTTTFAFISRITGPIGGDLHSWPSGAQHGLSPSDTHSDANQNLLSGNASWQSMLGGFSSILGPTLKLFDVLQDVDIGSGLAQLPALFEDQLNALNTVEDVNTFATKLGNFVQTVQSFRDFPTTIANEQADLIKSEFGQIAEDVQDAFNKTQTTLNSWFLQNIEPLLGNMDGVFDDTSQWADDVYQTTYALYQADLRQVAAYLSAAAITARFLQNAHSIVQILVAQNADPTKCVVVAQAGIINLLTTIIAASFADLLDTLTPIEQFASTITSAGQSAKLLLGQLGTAIKATSTTITTLQQLTKSPKDIAPLIISQAATTLEPFGVEAADTVTTQLSKAWSNAWPNASVDYANAKQEYLDKRNFLNTALLDTTNNAQASFTKVIDNINTAIQTSSAAHLVQHLTSDADDFIKSVFAVDSSAIQQVTDVFSTVADTLQALKGLIDTVESEIPSCVSASYSLNPVLRDGGPDGTPFFIASQAGQPAQLSIAAKITKTLIGPNSAAPPEVTISAKLSNFTIQMVPSLVFLKIGFNTVSFQSVNGAAPKVTMQIGGVELGGDLGFVKELEALLNGGSGPFMQFDGNSVVAGYRFPVPTQPVGTFILAQLAFDIGTKLYFDSGAEALAYLSISSRDKPCVLTSGIYGGTFYFALTATTTGIRQAEISFSFGVVAAMSIAGVSGVVTATGGVYFSKSDELVVLTGFFRATGCFDIFGLIQLNLDFYLGFTFQQDANGKGSAYGECEITVEIGFTFFSISYHLHAIKQVEGSSSGARANAQEVRSLGAAQPRTKEQPASANPTAKTPLARDWHVIIAEWDSRSHNYIPDDYNVFS